jgi:Skp family chaperone for outer membrane proteins
MKFLPELACGLAASALLLAGCDQQQPVTSPIAVLDLAAVAEATGEDKAIREKAEAAREGLGTQLQELAASMDKQLAAEREKIGVKPKAEDAQRLQEMTMQARQQINNAQQQAQNEASQIEAQLVEEFRKKVDPLAEKIAREKGAKALLAVDSYLFWHDPAIDITDQVVEAWRALPADKAEAAAAPAAATAPAEAPAAAPAAAQPAAAPEQNKAAE